MKPFHELTITETGSLLRNSAVSSKELTHYFLSRIGNIDDGLHAFITVTAERALEDAARADKELENGVDRGPMHGIPYALKDIFDTSGILTTCNSKLFIGHVPTEDAAVEKMLKTGGGVLLGKLATHEFAFGGPGVDLPFPPVRNPWNRNHFTGASSSGSAAAVAAGLTPMAIGSDTSGSIRGPASHCGVVGIKPTMGLVSMKGAYPLSDSLDHCGHLTVNVKDAALVLNVVANKSPDGRIRTDFRTLDYTSEIGKDICGFKIGFPRYYYSKPGTVSTEVMDFLENAALKMKEMGALVEDIILPDYELFNACGRIIMTAEAYNVHADMLRKYPEKYGRYTYQRLLAGATISAVTLINAYRLKGKLTEAINKLFLTYDAIMCATCLFPAPTFEEFPDDWPPPSSVIATHTIPFNITGHPVIDLPIGFTDRGLPVGMQLVGRISEEPALFRIAWMLESALDIASKHPLMPPGSFSLAEHKV